MSFINDNFMLKNEPAKKLYAMVKDLPIIDYHCHLQPKQIAENYQFKNAFDLFLGGDHYKWRQMRSNGIDEKFVTGDGDEFEKFVCFARTLEKLIGNPLYHWTHLELKRYFDIDEPLCEESAKRIWDKCNECLAKPEFRAQELIKRSNVEIICTTDDPIDTLEYHKALQGFSTKILPTFRPDKAVEIGKETFIPYIEQTGCQTRVESPPPMPLSMMAATTRGTQRSKQASRSLNRGARMLSLGYIPRQRRKIFMEILL